MKGRGQNLIIQFSNHKDEPQDSKQSAEKFAQHYWKKISNQSTPPNKRISYVEQAFLDMTTNQDYNRQFEYHKLSSENKNLKQNPSFEKNWSTIISSQTCHLEQDPNSWKFSIKYMWKDVSQMTGK